MSNEPRPFLNKSILSNYFLWLGIIIILVLALKNFFDFKAVSKTITDFIQLHELPKYYLGIIVSSILLSLVLYKDTTQRQISILRWLGQIILAGGIGVLTWYVVQYKNLIPELSWWSQVFGVAVGILALTILRGQWEKSYASRAIPQTPQTIGLRMVIVVALLYYSIYYLASDHPWWQLSIGAIWFFVVPSLLVVWLVQIRTTQSQSILQLINLGLTVGVVLPGLLVIVLNYLHMPLITAVIHVVIALVNFGLAGWLWVMKPQLFHDASN